MITTTIPTVPEAQDAAPLPAGVPLLDRVAMRIGLALLLWGRHHAAAQHVAPAARPTLVADARWYMR